MERCLRYFFFLLLCCIEGRHESTLIWSLWVLQVRDNLDPFGTSGGDRFIWDALRQAGMADVIEAVEVCSHIGTLYNSLLLTIEFTPCVVTLITLIGPEVLRIEPNTLVAGPCPWPQNPRVLIPKQEASHVRTVQGGSLQMVCFVGRQASLQRPSSAKGMQLLFCVCALVPLIASPHY